MSEPRKGFFFSFSSRDRRFQTVHGETSVQCVSAQLESKPQSTASVVMPFSSIASGEV